MNVIYAWFDAQGFSGLVADRNLGIGNPRPALRAVM